MDSPPEVAFFTLNGSWLGLYAIDFLAADAMVSSTGSGFKAFTLSHNVASKSHGLMPLFETVVNSIQSFKNQSTEFRSPLPV